MSTANELHDDAKSNGAYVAIGNDGELCEISLTTYGWTLSTLKAKSSVLKGSAEAEEAV